MNIYKAYQNGLIVVGRYIESNGDYSGILNPSITWNGSDHVRGIISDIKKDYFTIDGNYYYGEKKLESIRGYCIKCNNTKAYVKFVSKNTKKISCFAYWILKNKL
jgi:hypothetical protein